MSGSVRYFGSAVGDGFFLSPAKVKYQNHPCAANARDEARVTFVLRDTACSM